MFDNYLREINELVNGRELNASRRTYGYDESRKWPRVKSQIVFDADTAVDLGHSQTESVSFLIWADSAAKINDRQITLIGPELKEAGIKKIPFAKIVMVSVHGFNEENAFQRYQEMDAVRFDMNLDGYMLRALPQENKEWGRVGNSALRSGFSLQVLGNELIRDLKKLEYVDAAEIIFVTSSAEDVRRFKPIAEKATKACRAMNKMFDDLEYDCGSCNFADVCNEIDGLKTMHQKTGVAPERSKTKKRA
ncbi:MAG TPA: hypothetical protein VN441_11785 [Syntrophomonas sp.]|jgi:CO dehydrogenase/acetyl-CoA synthase beta subunit|nr:hypothetical protein [Syntrophomonas sp.]